MCSMNCISGRFRLLRRYTGDVGGFVVILFRVGYSISTYLHRSAHTVTPRAPPQKPPLPTRPTTTYNQHRPPPGETVMLTERIEFPKSYRAAWLVTIFFFWTILIPIVAFLSVHNEHYYFDGTRLIKLRGSREESMPIESIGRTRAHKRGFRAWSKDGGRIVFGHVKDGTVVNNLVKQTQNSLT